MICFSNLYSQFFIIKLWSCFGNIPCLIQRPYFFVAKDLIEVSYRIAVSLSSFRYNLIPGLCCFTKRHLSDLMFSLCQTPVPFTLLPLFKFERVLSSQKWDTFYSCYQQVFSLRHRFWIGYQKELVKYLFQAIRETRPHWTAIRCFLDLWTLLLLLLLYLFPIWWS